MIVILAGQTSLREKTEVVRVLEAEGLRVQVNERHGETIIGAVGQLTTELSDRLLAMPGVRSVDLTAQPYPLVSRELHPESTRVKVGEVVIGGDELVVIAGPCAVESEDQLLRTARAVASSGARLLRGGAFKPRTSPYSFQGLGLEGLTLLARARSETGLPVVTEVVAEEDVELVARHADMLQIGARNMQNFRLLSAAGAQGCPVLLKRGLMATLEELLLAAEYIVAAGNPRVILCERGIRTFERATRNTLDISAVPVLKRRTHLPVIVDPSHAAGLREIVPALALAAVAAGADGLIVEVHHDPGSAASDGRQSMTPVQFDLMMTQIRRVARAVSRHVVDPG